MAKGQKTGGRKKGVANKTTNEIRVHFQNLVSDNLEQLNEDLKSLEPLQRIKIIIEISKFIVPTLKAVELSPDTTEIFKIPKIEFVNAKQSYK